MVVVVVVVVVVASAAPVAPATVVVAVAAAVAAAPPSTPPVAVSPATVAAVSPTPATVVAVAAAVAVAVVLLIYGETAPQHNCPYCLVAYPAVCSLCMIISSELCTIIGCYCSKWPFSVHLVLIIGLGDLHSSTICFREILQGNFMGERGKNCKHCLRHYLLNVHILCNILK